MGYWQDRAELRQTQLDALSKATLHRVGLAYQSAIKQAQMDAERVLGNFVKAFQLTEQQAKDLLSQPASRKNQDILIQRIKSIADPAQRQYMQAKYSAAAYKERIDNLKLIEMQTQAELAQAAELERRLTHNQLRAAYRLGALGTSADLAKYLRLQPFLNAVQDKRIAEVLKNKWSGEHYSARIWANNRKMASDVAQGLIEAFTSGRTSRATFQRLMDNANGSRLAANRLLRTETNYVNNQATLDAYRHAGISSYRFSAVLDRRTSEICAEHDEKIYRVEDAVPGVNLPPLHPFCRSNIVPVFEDVKSVQEVLNVNETSEDSSKDENSDIIDTKEVDPEFKVASEDIIRGYQEQSDKLYEEFENRSKDYIDALSHYTGSGYFDINAAARGEAGFDDSKGYIKHINAAMEHFKLNDDLIVYRADKAEHYADKEDNKIHKANMFLSTSLSRQYAEEFGMDTGKDVMLEIKVPKGTKSIYIGSNSSYMNEFELLLSSETSYKITYRDERTIKMEVVHGKPRKS